MTPGAPGVAPGALVGNQSNALLVVVILTLVVVVLPVGGR